MGSPNPSNQDPILNFEDKRYDIKTLSDDVKDVVRGLQVADAQLRMHEDTLKVLAIGRQALANQLKDKLTNVKPL